MNKFLENKFGKKVQVCVNCIYDSTIKNIFFNKKGVCNYCDEIKKIKERFHTEKIEGKKKLNLIISEIKKKQKNSKYDCLVGVSGGTDSSFMVDYVIKQGLRPLAVHYDNTWNTDIATQNIYKVLKKLNVDLYTHVVNNEEIDDIHKSFLLAGTPDIDSPTDLGLAETLYRAAKKFKIKYIFEGHSFTTEGISPIGINYFDGRYIKEIHKKFGKKKMKTYPLMTLTNFLKWTIFYRIKKVRPFWYIKYSKTFARSYLKKKFGWKYYGGHHLENKMTRYQHNIYLKKFEIDHRNLVLGAAVREKKLKREDAWKIYNKKVKHDKEIEEYFIKRMKFSNEEYLKLMKKPPKKWQDYPNYKKTFEILSPIFYILMKLNIVNDSFYFKYCKKINI